MKIVNIPTPPLVKFCPDEFDITKGCNTLRFGTLFDYRTIEDEKLRDEGEGKFSYKISFPELTKVSNDWINTLEMDTGGDMYIEDLEISSEGVYIKGAELSGSSHNCWIFCMSKNSASAGDISKTHQSKWMIPFENLEPFANYLATLIKSEVNAADIPPYLLNKYSLQEIQQGLSIDLEICEVTYSDREILINSEADLPIQQLRNIRESIPFIKPKIFEPENEVRFAFWLMFRNEKISIVNKPKIVSLRTIDKMLLPTH